MEILIYIVCALLLAGLSYLDHNWSLAKVERLTDKLATEKKEGETGETEKAELDKLPKNPMEAPVEQEKKAFSFEFLALLMVCHLALVLLVYFFRKDYLLVAKVRWILVLTALLSIAIFDIRKQLILNHHLLIWLFLRIGLLIWELPQAGEYMSTLLTTYLLGAVLGGGVMLAVYLVSKGGLGFGDVKLFCLCGLSVGLSSMMEVMIDCFVVSAVVSLIRLLTKKAQLSDSSPLAPYLLIGAVLTVLM